MKGFGLFHEDGYCLLPVIKQREIKAWTKVDLADAAWLTKHNLVLNSKGYVRVSQQYLHRLLCAHLITPSLNIVDHVNRDKLDNRRCNLRPCDSKGNTRNASPRKRFKGVSFWAGKWRARIKAGDRIEYLGGFETEQEAANAYNARAAVLHAEFAVFNKSL